MSKTAVSKAKEKRRLELVERFQCPGCSAGESAESGCFQKEPDQNGVGCSGHSPGTFSSFQGLLIIGLPAGFNRCGAGKVKVRIYEKRPEYDRFNIPVWGRMESDGVVIVKTYLPRLNAAFVDVIDDGGGIPTEAIDMTNQKMD